MGRKEKKRKNGRGKSDVWNENTIKAKSACRLLKK